MKKINVGIDLGGSHVSIGIVSDEGKIIEQFEKDFTQEEKKDLINVAIKYIVDNIELLQQKYEITKCGLGMAGAMSNGIIVKSVNLGIKNYNIKEELESKTGIEFIVKNDAKCAAIAEYKYGNCKNLKNILFLTLGTGIGGAYISDGKLQEGNIFEGFELGHTVLKYNGIQCKCGKKGCFEKYGSILVYKNKVIKRLRLPHDISGPDLREQIKKHRNKVKDIDEEYIKDLALGISNLINIFEPDCTIIGGGFARYDYLLLEQLKKEILKPNLLFNERNEIEIKVATLGNDAGVIGASLL